MFLYKSKHEKVSTDHGAGFLLTLFLSVRAFRLSWFLLEKRALFLSAKAGANGKIDASTIKRAIQQHGKPFPHDMASVKQRNE